VQLLKRFQHFVRKRTQEEQRLALAMATIVGRKPLNIQLYKLAMRHSSVALQPSKGVSESNERLEYLGDAVLGTVVADYLFRKYPFQNEGFLTEIRSRIVNRESLNQLGRQLGLDVLLQFDPSMRVESRRSLSGNALEALIGAVYLDHGFYPCKTFIERRLLSHYFDLDQLINTIHNHKSALIEWAHKENRKIEFTVEEAPNSGGRLFNAEVMIDNEAVAHGQGSSKKRAQKEAARRAYTALGLED
jgi:ribonuclease-3